MKPVAIAVLLVLGGLLAQGVVAALRSQALHLEEFEVEGNYFGRVTAEEVVAATRLEKGEPLLTVSTGEVARNVEALPWVGGARAERILPSKLRIVVTERSPSWVVRTGAGPFLVDDSGLVLQAGEEALPGVFDLPIDSVAPGMVIDEPSFRSAMTGFQSLSDAVKFRVISVEASTKDRVTFNLDNGLSILFGAAEQLQEKNRALNEMLTEQADRPELGSVIDVSVPARPVIRVG